MTRPLYRPEIRWLSESNADVAVPPLDRMHLLALADVADSTAAGCAEWAERAPEVVAPGQVLDVHGARCYAEAARDVLRWLTGDAPSRDLADLLDLPTDTEEH